MSPTSGPAEFSGWEVLSWPSCSACFCAKPVTRGRPPRDLHMKPILILLACFLWAGVTQAQTSEVNHDSPADHTDLAAEVKALREALLQTQKQMAAQQHEIEALKERAKTEQAASVGNQPPPRMIDAPMLAAIPSGPGFANSSTSANVGSQPVS